MYESSEDVFQASWKIKNNDRPMSVMDCHTKSFNDDTSVIQVVKNRLLDPVLITTEKSSCVANGGRN